MAQRHSELIRPALYPSKPDGSAPEPATPVTDELLPARPLVFTGQVRLELFPSPFLSPGVRAVRRRAIREAEPRGHLPVPELSLYLTVERDKTCLLELPK